MMPEHTLHSVGCQRSQVHQWVPLRDDLLAMKSCLTGCQWLTQTGKHMADSNVPRMCTHWKNYMTDL